MGRIQRNPRDRIEAPDAWRSTPRPVDWIARREAVLERDGCCQWTDGGQVCGSTQDLECDHIGDPSNHDLSNLRMLCRPHHRRRTAQQGGLASAAARRRNPRRRPPEKHPGML